MSLHLNVDFYLYLPVSLIFLLLPMVIAIAAGAATPSGVCVVDVVVAATCADVVGNVVVAFAAFDALATDIVVLLIMRLLF